MFIVYLSGGFFAVVVLNLFRSFYSRIDLFFVVASREYLLFHCVAGLRGCVCAIIIA